MTPIDDTKYSVFAPSQAAMEEARARISSWLSAERTPELEFGAIYKAKVVEVRDIGVLVTLYSGMSPALVHNTQLDHRKVYNFFKVTQTQSPFFSISFSCKPIFDKEDLSSNA